MMAKQGIQLRACCPNSRERVTQGSTTPRRVSWLEGSGAQRVVLLPPPPLAVIIYRLFYSWQAVRLCCGVFLMLQNAFCVSECSFQINDRIKLG